MKSQNPVLFGWYVLDLVWEGRAIDLRPPPQKRMKERIRRPIIMNTFKDANQNSVSLQIKLAH